MQSNATLPASHLSARANELALGALVVAVIVMMALPLPHWLIDILVAGNIAIGVVLLMVALFVPSPLAFSSFPAVLLLTTLFRISLSVATTRQILLHAKAGDIIDAFGKLVVGGSLVVGLVVFLIITIVQFIVIAKGAERVAEVCARFTLDAMPGKQMAIDADLRAGVLSQNEATARRRELVLESQFYGAMDGAMKFVKGDAIAGIVIVLVNLVGGITIGVLVNNLPLAGAVSRYSILSIGDGLVTQIPALFVSISAGIAITRTAPDKAGNLAEQITTQLGSHPRALMLSAGVLALFAGVPGFPALTFLLLSALVGGAGLMLSRRQQADQMFREDAEVPSAAREGDSGVTRILADGESARVPSSFRLDLGEGLMDRLGASGLNAALQVERRQMREVYGLPFPGIELRRRADLGPDELAISLQQLEEWRGLVPDGMVLVIGPRPANADATASAQDPDTPPLGGPCWWDAAATAQSHRDEGREVLEGAALVARIVVRTMHRHVGAVLGVQEVRLLLRELEGRYADLAREAQQVLPLPRLADLMLVLAHERVPLADVPALLQALASAGTAGAADSTGLYESVRMALARGIVASLLPQPGAALPTLALDADFEMKLRSALTVRPDGPLMALSPPAAEAAQASVVRAFEAHAARDVVVLLLAADLRRACGRLLRGVLPRVAFVSREEVSRSGVQLDVVATISAPAELNTP